MRITRVLVAGLALTLVLPSLSRAQNGRGFTDSWFWGVKAGGLGYSKVTANPAATTSSYGQAPLAGVEWLITRTHAALYASFSQAFLSQQTLIPNSADAADTTFRVVDLKNVRKFDMALMAFPGDHLIFHPYVGLGFSFKTLGTATPRGPFATTDDLLYADATVQDAKASITPLAVVGGQYRFNRMSAFGQVTLTPADRNWILYNGGSMGFSYELGIRYNIGSSIEK